MRIRYPCNWTFAILDLCVKKLPRGPVVGPDGKAMATDQKPEVDPKNYVASVEKALRLLELFSEDAPQLGVREIVGRAGYSRTATYRLLTTLEHLGWIVRAGDKYQLSLRVFRLGSAAVGGLQLRQESSHAMSEVAAAMGETVYLVVPDGARAVCLERIEGTAQVQILVLDVGRSLPIYAGGASLAILSHRQDILDGLPREAPLPLPNGSSITIEELSEVCEATRRRGYSRSVEDVTPGVAAIGAPIRDNRGLVVGAVSVGGFAHAILRKEAELGQRLMQAADHISARLGYRA